MLGLRRGNGSMRRLSLIGLSVLVVVPGCGTATVTTTQPLTGDRPRPDRVIVQDFGVNAPADERRDGQAVAKTLTDTLITTLSDHVSTPSTRAPRRSHEPGRPRSSARLCTFPVARRSGRESRCIRAQEATRA